ncbi:MAG: choice-of-anchor D domain-containing protein [Planctomycetes bacterium]|nr:choice-of-anchor D domain-containing protein [Planctomycetota bacterium]
MSIDSYDFGEVEISDSAYFELEVMNHSSVTRKIMRIEWLGANVGDFEVEGATTRISIPAQESKFLNVWFSPNDEGIRSAILQIQTDADIATYNVDLTGCSIGKPEFYVPATKFDFGIGYTGYKKSQKFTIENNGTGRLLINKILISGSNASDFEIDCINLPALVLPKFSYPDACSFEIEVSFAPIFVGQSYAMLSIHHNSSQLVHVIDLISEARKPAPALKISTDDYYFGKVDVGNDSIHEFSIENTGVLDLSINKIEIKSGNTNDFSISEVLKSTGRIIVAPYNTTLSAGQRLSINISFSPTINDIQHISEMKVFHSLSMNPSIVQLSGDTGPSIVINECQTGDTPSGYGDWIEFRNRGNSIVDISGWTIECWQGTNLETTYRFNQGSFIGSYSHIVADDTNVGSTLPYFYIGNNLLWNRGGAFPGDYEVILKDANSNIIDYVCFGNDGVATPDHCPIGFGWGSQDYVKLLPGTQCIYRTSDQNSKSSQDWAVTAGSGTPLQKNPGQ